MERMLSITIPAEITCSNSPYCALTRLPEGHHDHCPIGPSGMNAGGYIVVPVTAITAATEELRDMIRNRATSLAIEMPGHHPTRINDGRPLKCKVKLELGKPMYQLRDH